MLVSSDSFSRLGLNTVVFFSARDTERPTAIGNSAHLDTYVYSTRKVNVQYYRLF
jgi:hypothetical protein